MSNLDLQWTIPSTVITIHVSIITQHIIRKYFHPPFQPLKAIFHSTAPRLARRHRITMAISTFHQSLLATHMGQVR